MAKKLKINHVLSSIDVSTGGPARIVADLIDAMLNKNSNLEVDLNTLKSENPIIESIESNNGKINFHNYGFLGYSKSLRNNLNNSNSDLCHGHGLWQIPVHQMAKYAQKNNIPYIISPHGMLEPWALQQGKLKKKLALKLFQYKDLSEASCLLATAPMELESIRELDLKNPIAIIPNGINIKAFPSFIPVKAGMPKKILFLSRIHPKKGIENLIEAWNQLESKIRKNWVIEIVGNGDESYIKGLQQKIISYNLVDQIVIKAPVFGEGKIKIFREASLFVLPTFCENFGIVVAEALASYTPVITTKGTPWEELNTCNAGWWIDLGLEPLKKALITAMQTEENELITMGLNGRKLIEDKYGIEAVAQQMIQLYHWLLNKGEKPEFVITLPQAENEINILTK